MANKEIKKGGVTRVNHKGQHVIMKGVTSNRVDVEKTKKYIEKKKDDFSNWTSEP